MDAICTVKGQTAEKFHFIEDKQYPCTIEKDGTHGMYVSFADNEDGRKVGMRQFGTIGRIFEIVEA